MKAARGWRQLWRCRRQAAYRAYRKTGTVLGHITALGVHAALDPDATDGSQHAVGILIGAAEAESAGDSLGVAIVRDANINPGALVWPDGFTAEDKAAALAALAAQGIVAREEC